jgi:phage/conjugal plasmid C-4 type zinc finger TraR family protein
VDDVDRANDQVERERTAVLAAHAARWAAVPTHTGRTRCCADCGLPIDPRRLAALPGVIRCVGCQEWAEWVAV